MTATARLVITIVVLVAAVAGVFAVALLRGERPAPQQPAVVELPRPVAVVDTVPVLHLGRVKPLRVAAEEQCHAVTGKGAFGITADGRRAGALHAMLDIQARPEAWRAQPLVYAPFIAVQKQIGITGQHVSLDRLDQPDTRGLLDFSYRKKAQARAQGERVVLTSAEAAAAQLAERGYEAQALLAGDLFALAPILTTAEQRAWLLDRAAELAEPKPGEARWRTRARLLLQQIERVKPQGEAVVAAVWNTPEADLWWSLRDLAFAPDPLLASWPDATGLASASAAWGASMRSGQNQETATAALIAVLRTGGDAHVAALRTAGAAHLPAYPTAGMIGLELGYLRWHPFGLACIGFLLGAVLVAVGWLRTGVGLTIVAMLAIVAGLTVRVVLSGMAPVTNLYETVIFVSLIASGLSLLLLRLNGNRLFAVAGGIAAGLCALVGELMPPEFGTYLSQLQPVLRTRFWLWVHVLTIVASYGAFLLAWVMGNIVLFRAVHRGERVPAAESVSIYRALQVGVVLVAAGTLLGGMWADEAWGRFWGWDPKEVWALVILLVYLVPLHLRYAGVVGPTGLAGWAVYGFLSVIMSWYGVNFLLGAGLHAYATGKGFADSFSTDQVVVLGLSVVQLVVTTIQLLILRRTRATN